MHTDTDIMVEHKQDGSEMTMPPEKLDAQAVDMQRSCQFLFLTSLLRVRRGWFANQALSLRVKYSPLAVAS